MTAVLIGLCSFLCSVLPQLLPHARSDAVLEERLAALEEAKASFEEAKANLAHRVSVLEGGHPECRATKSQRGSSLIQGSTRLWKADSEVMHQAMEHQHTLHDPNGTASFWGMGPSANPNNQGDRRRRFFSQQDKDTFGQIVLDGDGWIATPKLGGAAVDFGRPVLYVVESSTRGCRGVPLCHEEFKAEHAETCRGASKDGILQDCDEWCARERCKRDGACAGYTKIPKTSESSHNMIKLMSIISGLHSGNHGHSCHRKAVRSGWPEKESGAE